MDARLDAENRFLLNLDALRSIDPSLADQLADLALPSDIEFIETFDGQPSCRAACLSPSGWFAHSGLPATREEIVIQQFTTAGANVILPATGHGCGIRRLLNQLASHNTVFVCDAVPLHFAILLRLHDFADDLRLQRLVLIPGDPIDQRLRDYFATHPRMIAPRNMLCWPWFDGAELRHLSAHISTALADIGNETIRQTDAARRTLAERSAPAMPDAGPLTLMVVSTTGFRAADTFAHALADALTTIGHTATLFCLDRPAHHSAIALVDTLLNIAPHALISVGASFSDLPAKPAASTPTISVLALPTLRPTGAALERLSPAPAEHILAATTDDISDMIARLPRDRFCVCPAAVDTNLFAPRDAAPTHDILLVADLADLTPATHGVRQDSHETLWHAIVRRARESAQPYAPEQAADLLRRCCHETGIDLTDDLATGFENLIRNAILPTIFAIRTAHAILAAKRSLQLIGHNWSRHTTLATHIVATPTSPDDWADQLASVRIVAMLNPTSNLQPLVLQTLAMAKPPIVRDLANDPLPTIAPLANATTFVPHHRPIVDALKPLLSPNDRLRAALAAARDHLVEHHSFAQLARTVTDLIRQEK